MGSNLGAAPAFEPPDESDIKLAWSGVRLLDGFGHDITAAAVARCIFALEQIRSSVGLQRPDPQQWEFPE